MKMLTNFELLLLLFDKQLKLKKKILLNKINQTKTKKNKSFKPKHMKFKIVIKKIIFEMNLKCIAFFQKEKKIPKNG